MRGMDFGYAVKRSKLFALALCKFWSCESSPHCEANHAKALEVWSREDALMP